MSPSTMITVDGHCRIMVGPAQDLNLPLRDEKVTNTQVVTHIVEHGFNLLQLAAT